MAVILLLFILFMFTAMGCSKGPQEAPPAPAVEVMTVIQKDVPVYQEWIGTLDGMVNATIRAQVQGYLIRQNYKEGDLVPADARLLEAFEVEVDNSSLTGESTPAQPLE